MSRITNKHIIKIKELISDEVCMGTFGLVELELLEMEKDFLDQLQNKSSNSDYAKCLQRFCDLLDDDDCFDWHGDISGFIEKYKKHFA